MSLIRSFVEVRLDSLSEGCGKSWRWEHTCRADTVGAQLLIVALLVSAADVAYTFVTRGEQDDSNQG